ncbi:hypothetical protein SEEPB759_18915 [Salmonella enterica subsp. enterica serovar Paratyphi B str. ATCC 8759]|nr:hypothetical protein SEEPB759_18915 [Salmonella enterica subsp. enterica serovar Paratyphi B str. ATCC 8759]
MSEKWSKEFDSCFQVGSIEEIADALEKRSGSEENALAMLAMTAFTLMTRRGICEMQNVAPDGKGIRLELIGFREKALCFPAGAGVRKANPSPSRQNTESSHR